MTKAFVGSMIAVSLIVLILVGGCGHKHKSGFGKILIRADERTVISLETSSISADIDSPKPLQVYDLSLRLGVISNEESATVIGFCGSPNKKVKVTAFYENPSGKVVRAESKVVLGRDGLCYLVIHVIARSNKVWFSPYE